MNYQIKNEQIAVTISDLGAELRSILGTDGTEYLWQGDSNWKDTAPNLFPCIGRLHEQTYRFRGSAYQIDMHGFVKSSVLTVVRQSETECVFELRASEKTKQSYPFAFVYQIGYQVEGNRLLIRTRVENQDDKNMFFAVGGHPSFNVPLDEGVKFEDYYLEFSAECEPKQIEILSDRLYSGRDILFPLTDKRRLHLNYDLFDENALVLRDMDQKVTLKTDLGSHGVTLEYPDMRYLGIWSFQRKYLPYLCIEPWSSVFGRSGTMEDLARQPSLIPLSAGSHYQTEWSITVF